ncbi:MAG: bifunctional ornithine acetyltransferase/N-acetylglutamate synthase [Planctomycetaceae bacterium]|nr:bifunctional ornithine acetyltransferase/N-acetylglutamate synthase [Planctomycetaceae bacterium]
MTNLLSLPQGFKTAGVACGIKQDATTLDLALFVSDTPCTAAGVFTQNRVCGAPVTVSRGRVPANGGRAVVINSGNANACTGERGIDDARTMTSDVAGQLGCSPDDVLVCSTGIIGHFLPMERIVEGIPRAVAQLGASSESFEAAAQAMRTTDTFTKLATRTVEINGKPVRVSGAAKGAAMIGPNMATMLAVIMTDAGLSPDEADGMLRHAVDRSFNCIVVEGHMSTSDTVLLLANGAAGVASADDADRQALRQAFDEVAEELAVAIIRDAEGADHLITVDVNGLRTRDEARCIAKAVSEGALVKTAVTGADPNWGRIVSAAGYAGVEFEEQDVSLRINGTLIYERGVPLEYDEAGLSQQMRENREVSIALDFTLGDEGIRYWTSDLTAEYVRLNSEYTT